MEALGHTISNKGLLPLEKNIDSIKKLDNPSNVTELRSFLGMVGYYRNFIENYATLNSPLCKLQRKNSTFEWTNEHTTSIEKLREALCQALILSYPRYDKPFIIRTDDSYQGIGVFYCNYIMMK